MRPRWSLSAVSLSVPSAPRAFKGTFVSPAPPRGVTHTHTDTQKDTLSRLDKRTLVALREPLQHESGGLKTGECGDTEGQKRRGAKLLLFSSLLSGGRMQAGTLFMYIKPAVCSQNSVLKVRK